MADALHPAQPLQRLTSMDAYRGFVMLLLAAEQLRIPQVASHFPDSGFWQFLQRQSNHVSWAGCSLHDLIQPSFSFLVGVALPFSLASRLAKDQSKSQLWAHALWRSLLLILLGVFLRSTGRPMTNWTFEDTLSQIGLGYPFLFALGFLGNRVRWTTLGVILVGYWLAFAAFRLPPPDVDYDALNVHGDARAYMFDGFAAHWNVNTNPAWAFDTWFLNLFPREHRFVGNPGGYATLNFIPTLGTMILGLIAGAWIRESRLKSAAAPEEAVQDSERLLFRLATASLVCIALGWLCQVVGICPIVKKIWTPSWTLFSGGWCFFLLAAFYYLIDFQGWRRWTFPLVVLGMNSIAIYVLLHVSPGYFGDALDTHLGAAGFRILGDAYEPLLRGAVVLLILWLILFWMYRRKLFLRI